MREADRIKEKIQIRLDGKQVGGLVLGAAIVAGGVFWAGYVMGAELGRPPAPTPTAVVVEAPMADRAAPAPAAAPMAPPKFTYDRSLTTPTPPVQIDDPTLQIGHEKREELQAKEKAAAQRAMTAFAEAKLADDALLAPPAGPTNPPPPNPEAVSAPEPVEVAPEAPVAAPDEPAVEAALPAKGASAYTIQIKAFRNRDEAREFMAVLTQSGHKPYTQAANIPGKGRFYRVRLGKFTTPEAAEAKRKAFVRAEGLEAIVAPMED